MSANDQRRAHFYKVAKAKEEVGTAVYDEAMRVNCGPMNPSIVLFTWFVPDKRRRDVDGLGPFVKAALDGLVKAGVWEDDQSDYVQEVRLRIDKSDPKNARIEVLISEVCE